MTGHDDERGIESAVIAWARSVFSAPRRLDQLVTSVEARDEIIERVATRIRHRELREQRVATSERRSTRPRVEQSSVDPFAHTHETLRADSEYVTQCDACAGSGQARCGSCRGTGNESCPTCRGSGKERSAKTGRPIKCKTCKATGAIPCHNCAGQGSVHCGACLGSGHQLAWLGFVESERWEVSVPTSNPVVIAHPALREGRALNPSDLTTLTVSLERSHGGALDLQQLAESDRRVVRAQLDQLDRRLDRVLYQQYLKLAAVRRDVTFEMCGTRATLSLTGTQLVGATTREVLRPIRRRLYAWLALCLLVGVAGIVVSSATIGSSQYYQAANSLAAILIMAAVTCAVPSLGALLRSWRGGWRFHPIRSSTKVWSAATGVALAAIGAVGLAARPDASEVQGALAANDTAQARAVVDALEEHGGVTRETMDLRDRVTLAGASRLSGEPRLRALDSVAAHAGAASAAAAAAARAQRLGDVRQLIAAHRPAEALGLLDQAFAGDHSPEINEQRARAHDTALSACRTPACQLDEAIRARDAQATPERAAALDAARARLIAALDPEQVPAVPIAVRLRRLGQLGEAAASARKVALGDQDLQMRAQHALAFVDAARAAVRLLGNDLAVAEQLLGTSTRSARGIPSIALDGVTVFLVLDRGGLCSGVYVTGDKAHMRAIASKDWTATRLLSQVLGRATALPPPRDGQTVVRWYAGGAAIVARWYAGTLVELRVGDAMP
jgi:hypothetical protein